jgi:hypothetical protein
MFQMEFQLVRKQLTHSLTHSLPMGPQDPQTRVTLPTKGPKRVNQHPPTHHAGWMVCGTENTFPLYLHPSTYLVVMSRLTSDFPTYLVTRVPYLITYL